MNELLVGYATDITIMTLLVMLMLIAVREGLKMLYEIQTLANKVLKRAEVKP